MESSDWREDEFRKLVEAQVQIILDEQAHGAKNAIRLAALTEKVIARLGDLVGNRKVATVRRRVEEGVSALSEVGFCGSLSSVGVFIPETADEIDAVTGEQFRRGFKTLRRARGFKRATVDALLAFAGQLGLLDTKEKAA